MKNQFADTQKGTIEYTWLGNGPVILVCHGTSSDCFSTDGYEPLLKAGFSVLSPSRPGYGHTSSVVGTSAKEASEALSALLDTLEIKKCSVMAVSGGGPTGIYLAANYPKKVGRFALVAALSRTDGRVNEPSYQSQVAFYGPMHNVTWAMLQLMSRLSPKSMALQTMTIFSTHDPQDSMHRLTTEDIKNVCHFYQNHSSRKGALNDLTHTVSEELFQKIKMPTLVIHSREDKSVPFSHAEWSLAHIQNVELCEGGFTGHFYWIGPDYQRISQRLIEFFKAGTEA
jgi:pimeloyl-ACP methyl ester carboxylesterase